MENYFFKGDNPIDEKFITQSKESSNSLNEIPDQEVRSEMFLY